MKFQNIVRIAFCASLTMMSAKRTYGFAPLSDRRVRLHHRESNTKAFLVPPVINEAHIALSQSVLDHSRSLLQMYGNLLADSPITTKSITSGTLAFIGDSIAQQFSKKKGEEFEYDFRRGLCFLLFGAAYTGAFQHFWFEFLGSHIEQWGESLKLWGPTRVSIPVGELYSSKDWWSYFDVVSGMENPPSDVALAVSKLSINQFLMVPSFYMPLFFALTGLLANLSKEESLERAKSMYGPLLARNYFFWLPMQFVQFFAIPVQWQIPFLSAASLLWTVILSSLSTQTSPPSEAIAYESSNENGEPEVSVVPAGDTIMEDAVSLEDVERIFIPEPARQVLSDPKASGTALGGIFALLAAAADDGLIAEALAQSIGLNIGASVEALTAAGAITGLVIASQTDNAKEPNLALGNPEDEMYKFNETQNEIQTDTQNGSNPKTSIPSLPTFLTKGSS